MAPEEFEVLSKEAANQPFAGLETVAAAGD
jgi:hypothetical protein